MFDSPAKRVLKTWADQLTAAFYCLLKKNQFETLKHD